MIKYPEEKKKHKLFNEHIFIGAFIQIIETFFGKRLQFSSLVCKITR